MELGLSLGKAAAAEAGTAAPELGLGLAVGVGAGRQVEGVNTAAVARGRWWATPAAPPEPAVRLSLVSSLGIQWPPSGSGECCAVLGFLFRLDCFA